MFSQPFTASSDESELDDMCGACPKLSYQQRIIGFCICCGIGYAMSFVGTMILVTGGTNAETIRQFAALYILGNFIAIAAMLFLIGPGAQCKKMCDKTRRISTVVWIATLIITFAIALAGVDVGWVRVSWCLSDVSLGRAHDHFTDLREHLVFGILHTLRPQVHPTGLPGHLL